ncbi:MAG: hypothetical protein HQ567_25505 [Candidatus Nealsonbacteria bacterium]|nr:hypothetical protein [Candidatus Nealsonbacteria bacterium]
MPDLHVRPVSTRREKKLFLELPWKMHRDDPNWIPPLRGNQAELVGYRPNPFYDRNRIQTFLAWRDGEVCGRVAAILNQGHIQQYNERLGFFGFFECIDDQEVAAGLFDAVVAWFAGQGIFKVRGPMNPSLNHELGLLVEGFDSSPTFMMTYNPEFYARLIEDYGFAKVQDLYAYFGHREMLPKIQGKLEPVALQIIERYDVHLRTLDRSRFLEDVQGFLSVYNRALANTWGFVPMSPAEIIHTAKGLQHLIVPELAVVAEVDGKMVGSSFALPDYNPRIKQIDGRLFPFGFIRLLRKREQIKRVRIISTNVIPEYQRMGVGLVLMHGLMPLAMKWDLQEAEFSWVLESNMLSRGSLEKGGAKQSKTYRLYDFDAGGPDGEASAPQQKPTAIAVREPSGPLEVHEVQSRRDLDRFVKLPWKIYANDPQWVPPLIKEVKEFLDPRKHPFYLHGEAAKFLVTRGGVVQGRILVSDDPRYNEEQGTNVGCFGMFECVDDREAAGALLDTAAGWLRGRGRDAVMGPIDYSTNYPAGLLVDGFDTPPRFMMNHHRPYYAALLESWGLTKTMDLYAWWFTDRLDMVGKWRDRLQRIAKRSRITVRPFRKDDFDAEVERCRAIYNQALQGVWGFVALTDAEFRYFGKQLFRIGDPNLVLFAEVDDEPVGIALTLPDVNEMIAPLDGRLTRFGLPVGLLRFMRRQRHVKTARMVLLDVVKGYRRRGIAELLILETLDYGKNTVGFTGAELGWTLETNDMVNRTVERVGARRYKTYRVYEKSLEG